MGVTDDRKDPRLSHGVDEKPVPMAEVYLVLSEEERAKGFVRPFVRRYVHARDLGGCGTVTLMGVALSETYARSPGFYGATYCVGCSMHRPVGVEGEFYWCGEVGDPFRLDRETGTRSEAGELWRVGT